MILSKLSGSQQGHPRGRVPPFLCRGAMVAVAPDKSGGVKETTGLGALEAATGILTGLVSLWETTSIALVTEVERTDEVSSETFVPAIDAILTFVTAAGAEGAESSD